MRIGIVTQSYYPKPGGVTEVVFHNARELRALGHEVTVVTTRYSGKEPGEPGIVRIGRNFLVPVNGAWVNVTAAAALASRLHEVFEEGRFDIIQTHCPLVPTMPLAALKAAGALRKIVGTFHAAAETNLAYRLCREPLRRRAARLDGRIAVSRAAMNFAQRYFPGSYEIIPNGIDCDRFSPSNEPLERYRDGRINILFVGRMDKRKGLPNLFRALPVAQRRLNRQLRLILVGEGRFRRLLMPKPLRMHGAEIVYAGRIPPAMLPRYYASADICCFPATGRESFGIVLLESMATGVPVIASDIPGFRTVLDSGIEGLFTRPADSDDIARALVELAGDPGLRAEMGRRGREKALTYDWPAVTAMLEQYFRRITGIAAADKIAASIPRSVV